jgi:hypothetical protein
MTARSLRLRAIVAAAAGLAAWTPVAFAAAVSETETGGGEPAASSAGPARSGPMSVVVGVDPDRLTCFMGGSVGGVVLTAEALAARLRDGQPYRLFDLSGAHGETLSIGRPRSEGGEGECVDLWRQDLALDPRESGSRQAALHLPPGAPDPLPGQLEVLDRPLGQHVELMREFLARRGIADPEPGIVQSIRTDLEGDGAIDHILNLVRVGPDHARAGDHSIIVMVRGEGPAQRTFIIQEEVDVSDSAYSSTLWVNTIVALVDINGDGTAEIITEGGYLYGGGWEVIGWDGNGFEHILFCGCDG